MKYLNGFMVAVFIGLLVLMRNYDVLFQTYGLVHSLDMVFGYTAVDVYSALGILGNNGWIIALAVVCIIRLIINIHNRKWIRTIFKERIIK